MAEVVVVGDTVTDVLAHLSASPARGSDVNAEIALRPGGQGAATSAWLAHAGASVHLVSCVGADDAGERLEAALTATGVCTHLQRRSEAATGAIVVLVDRRGERTMLTDRGANRLLRPVPAELVSVADHLHLSGYPLLDEASRGVGRGILEAARQAGLSVSVSPSSRAPLAAAGAGSFLAWTGGADLCLANRDEAAELTGAAEPATAAARLLEHYRAAAVTSGPDGAWFASREHGELHLPAPDAAVVDTTGAGDAFAAGFLAGWLTGAPPVDAVQQGLGLARRAVCGVGSWPGDQ